MSQLVLSRGNRYRKNIFSKIIPNVELGPYFLVGSLVLFVVLITVITLLFSTRQVTKGYVLNMLESEHQELTKANEIQDMELSKVRSLNFIKESSKVRSMVRADQIVFIKGDTAVASR